MRIKFEKGFTPELIGEIFARIIKEDEIVIGAVNIYIQAYDDEMKPIPFMKDESYIIVEPNKAAKRDYENDVVNKRRGKLRVVSG